MSWIAWVIIAIMFLVLGGLAMGILYSQKKIDAPYAGILLVDRQNPDEPPMVYFQAVKDPGTFTDGESIKLKVQVVKSQGKQLS